MELNLIDNFEDEEVIIEDEAMIYHHTLSAIEIHILNKDTEFIRKLLKNGKSLIEIVRDNPYPKLKKKDGAKNMKIDVKLDEEVEPFDPRKL